MEISPRTVLLAEDHDAIRRMITAALERQGCRVLSAADGLEAMTLFHANMADIDVVALDVRMPNMQGPQALTRMRALRPALPAILMSGFTDSTPELAVLLQSNVRFVSKPLRAVVLAQIICDLAVAAP